MNVLVIDEDGDWRIDTNGKRGAKGIMLDEWLAEFEQTEDWPLRFRLERIEGNSDE